MTDDLDKKYLRCAYVAAREWSKDQSTQNGALLVDFSIRVDGFIAAQAANVFPRGVEMTEERWQRPAKYQYVEHAERNVIYHAARNGFRTEGLTMYCPWAACADCARAIIQAGISRLVTHKFPGMENDRWDESIKVAMGMLSDAGVIVSPVEAQLFTEESGFAVLRNGQLFTP